LRVRISSTSHTLVRGLLYLNMPKEIDIPNIKPARHEDLNKRHIVFEYKGRINEVNDFVRLAREMKLDAEMPQQDMAEGLSHFKITVPRRQFEKLMTVLHEWKTVGQQ
jgi:hypothetical protein